MDNLQVILAAAASHHSHLCPRQVLGARMGLAGAALLGLDTPVPGKRLLIISETDGCFIEGLEAATGCSLGHRTLRVVDFGKIAATFIDVETGHAYRLAPRAGIRLAALQYAPGETRRYFAQLQGYQIMPDEELLSWHEVHLNQPVKELVSRPGVRAECEACGEEIINEREVIRDGHVFCRACAGMAYYLEAAPLKTSGIDLPRVEFPVALPLDLHLDL
jgi:formylmethanofuran dehydrogenase subunit E